MAAYQRRKLTAWQNSSGVWRLASAWQSGVAAVSSKSKKKAKQTSAAVAEQPVAKYSKKRRRV